MKKGPLREAHKNHPCPFCGYTMTDELASQPTVDHVLPRSRNGNLIGSGKLVTCWTCNQDRGDLTVREWLDLLIVGGDDRAGYVVDWCLELVQKESEGARHLLGISERLPLPGREKKPAGVPLHPVRPRPATAQKCSFPACLCVGACQRHGRPAAKDAPG